jgi:hypothetical protein
MLNISMLGLLMLSMQNARPDPVVSFNLVCWRRFDAEVLMRAADAKHKNCGEKK